MQSGPFIAATSAIYKVAAPTVREFARILKANELFSTGARGVNAPHMTPLDAARITLALLGTERPSQAAEVVRKFGAYTFDREMSRCSAREDGGDPEYAPDVEEVLAAYFSFDHRYGMIHEVKIEPSGYWVGIERWGGSGPTLGETMFFTPAHQTLDQLKKAEDEIEPKRGIRRTSSLLGYDMMELAKCVRDD